MRKDAKKNFHVPLVGYGQLAPLLVQRVFFSNMRKGEAYLPARLDRRQAIAAKCHPAIFEVAAILKEHTEADEQLRPARDPQQASNRTEALYQELQKLREKYATEPFGCPDCGAPRIVMTAIFGDATPGNTSGKHWLADWLHWQRYGIPLRVDIRKREAGDEKATQRTLRTEQDYEKLRHGGRLRTERVKRDVYHTLMFMMLWDLGIEKLSSEELADFFDWFCPCKSNRHQHSAEALKKQRARFKKVLALAPDWSGLTVQDWLQAAEHKERDASPQGTLPSFLG